MRKLLFCPRPVMLKPLVVLYRGAGFHIRGEGLSPRSLSSSNHPLPDCSKVGEKNYYSNELKRAQHASGK